MAPVLDTRHATVLKAFLILGLLLFALGVDGAGNKTARRTWKQERSSRGKDQKMAGVLDRVPRGAAKTVKLVFDQEFIPQSVPFNPWRNSISPWNYSSITDNDLIPSVIPQAHCLKQGCMDANGEEDVNLSSKPIELQIMVLRRVKHRNDVILLKMEKKMITVGCTCVRPSVLSQD